MLHHHSECSNSAILFSELSLAEGTFNKVDKENYVRNPPRIERGHYPASVLAWWGVSYDNNIPTFIVKWTNETSK